MSLFGCLLFGWFVLVLFWFAWLAMLTVEFGIMLLVVVVVAVVVLVVVVLALLFIVCVVVVVVVIVGSSLFVCCLQYRFCYYRATYVA